MKIGFTGTRKQLEFYQRKIVTDALEKLVPETTYAITGACVGLDSFVAHWFEENSDAQQIIVVPSKREHIDETVYGLRRTTIIEMPVEGDEAQNMSASMRRRNTRLVELSDRFVAFWNRKPRSGTVMTMNIARQAGILAESDVHKI